MYAVESALRNVRETGVLPDWHGRATRELVHDYRAITGWL
jgi:hypothetical protein